MTSFRIVGLFIFVTLIGLLLLPALRISYLPLPKTKQLSVLFTVRNSPPALVEQEATAMLENAFSQLSDLKSIQSFSGYNEGLIKIKFHPAAQMAEKRFELATLIRRIYPKLSEQVSYPHILDHGAQHKYNKQALLIYTIEGPFAASRIREETEQYFQKSLMEKRGLDRVEINGAEKLQVSIRFDRQKMETHQLSTQLIQGALDRYFLQQSPSMTYTKNRQFCLLKLKQERASIASLAAMNIANKNGRLIQLQEIAEVHIEEQKASSYFRVNSQTAVHMALYARDGENKLLLANQLKNQIQQINASLNSGLTARLEYDDTAFLKEELEKTYLRLFLSVGILLLFLLLAYQNWRYLIVLLAGLVVNLSVTLLAVYLLHIEVHLYTIAGLAIAFGLMIDNAIVMLDYYGEHRNRKAFPALLGATMTSIVALLLVLLLPEEDRAYLTDFVAIVCLSLGMSLLTTLLFIPGFYQLLFPSPAFRQRRVRRFGRLRQQFQLFRLYRNVLSFTAYYRKTFFMGLILTFGLPFFLLPRKVAKEKWYANYFNSRLFQEQMRPYADYYLGGIFRPFVEDVSAKAGYRDLEKTRLYVHAGIDFGHSLEQMDDIIRRVEKLLEQIKGIEKYVSKVHSGQYAVIEVNFEKAYENTLLPIHLKNQLIAFSQNLNGVDWHIKGVGESYSLNKGKDIPVFRVRMKGYNYNELEQQAKGLAKLLLQHKRIPEVNENEQLNFNQRPSQELVLNYNEDRLHHFQTNPQQIVSAIRQRAPAQFPAGKVAIGQSFFPVMIEERRSQPLDRYQLLQDPLWLHDSTRIDLQQMGALKKSPVASVIQKEDRQYIRMLSFEYMGAMKFGNQFLKKTLDQLSTQMPNGYSAKQEENIRYGFQTEDQNYLLLLVLIFADFVICSLLFESLKKPLVIIATVPISFIGLMAVFVTGGFFFDQGGFAAFVVLGGIVVNAAIFILHDFQLLRPTSALYNKQLVKAAFNRSRTILLTIASTICGLLPFLIGGQNDVFWFALAVGTIGGLLFSILAVFFALPMMMWRKSHL